jgi:hypothetical protein
VTNVTTLHPKKRNVVRAFCDDCGLHHPWDTRCADELCDWSDCPICADGHGAEFYDEATDSVEFEPCPACKGSGVAR